MEMDKDLQNILNSMNPLKEKMMGLIGNFQPKASKKIKINDVELTATLTETSIVMLTFKGKSDKEIEEFFYDLKNSDD